MPSRLIRIASLSVTLFALLALVRPPALAKAEAEYVSDEVVIGVKPEYWNRTRLATITQGIGEVLGGDTDLGAIRLHLYPGVSVRSAIAALKQQAGVTFAEPNYIRRTCATPNDPSYATQYGPQKIKADKAWDIYSPKAQVILAIVDTGVSYSHPDLSPILLKDANNTVIGWNAQTSVANADDDNGHGSHCAGIAAGAINNGIGIAGIAGWNPNVANSTTYVRVMPVKVLSSAGSGSDTNVADGIKWAADHNASIISMSLGGSGTSTTLSNAVAYAQGKGVLVIAAAGNSSSNSLFYPAGYAGVVSVASTDNTDTLSSFSNYGTWVKVAAPGSNIYSSYLNNGYATLSGTSMATPHVAGLAAMIRAHNPNLTATQVSDIITASANVDPYTPYSGRTIAANAGRINAQKALTAATPSGPPVNGSAFVSQTVPATMTTGQTYPITITMKNTGNTTWGSTGSYHLGPQNPQDNNIWGAFRVSPPNDVTPGQSVTFAFNVTAPAQPGTYNFQWRVLQDGVEWFGDYTTNVQVVVGRGTAPAANSATFVSQTVPSTMVSGQNYPVSITMKNTGTTTWSAAGRYNLGSQNPQDNGTWGGRIALPNSVAPGQSVTFTTVVNTPVLPGTYNFQWRMVQEGVEWFGDFTPNVPVVVTSPTPTLNNSTFVSQQVPTTMIAGQTYTVSITMQNSGNSAWFAATQYRLGAQNPQDNTTWGVGRVELPQSISPGQNVTFTYSVRAPSSPGTYNFRWRMVQELVEWFGDFTPNVSVLVQ